MCKTIEAERFRCANCTFVFDTFETYVDCPVCGSNACDLIQQFEFEREV